MLPKARLELPASIVHYYRLCNKDLALSTHIPYTSIYASACLLVHCLWSMVLGLWPVVYGLWSVGYGLWTIVSGLSSLVYGLWSVVSSLWSSGYGLGYMVYNTM